MADFTYRLLKIDDSESFYQCITLDVTPTTITGINEDHQYVFVVPVSQVKVLEKQA